MVYFRTPSGKTKDKTGNKDCGVVSLMSPFRSLLTTYETGVAGEETAAMYLHGLGYDIRERNTRFGRLEIDIIAYDNTERMIVFVEVKARRSHSQQYPIRTAVNQRKRRALRKAINKWILLHQYDGPGRMDIISVSRDNIVEHLMDVGSDFF